MKNIDQMNISDQMKKDLKRYEAFACRQAEEKHNSNLGCLIQDVLTDIFFMIDNDKLPANAKIEDFMVDFIRKEVDAPVRERSCFGLFGMAEVGGFMPCNAICGDDRYICITEQNKTRGACNCPYKASCHTPRQMNQANARKTNGHDITWCWFYKQLKPMYEKEAVKNENTI